MSKERYNIYYEKYCIFANSYRKYITVIETEDIYHEVGKIICTSLENIKSVRYTKPQASYEKCKQFFEENGYRQITNTDLWVLDKKDEQL